MASTTSIISTQERHLSFHQPPKAPTTCESGSDQDIGPEVPRPCLQGLSALPDRAEDRPRPRRGLQVTVERGEGKPPDSHRLTYTMGWPRREKKTGQGTKGVRFTTVAY